MAALLDVILNYACGKGVIRWYHLGSRVENPSYTSLEMFYSCKKLISGSENHFLTFGGHLGRHDVFLKLTYKMHESAIVSPYDTLIMVVDYF